MAFTSGKMGLRVWNLLTDLYDHAQLADNWAKVDYHDHSPGRGVLVTGEGIADGAIGLNHMQPGVVAIPDGSITNVKMAPDAISTATIVNEAVTAAKLAPGVAIPAGMLSPYAGSTAPTGWLLADGTAVSRSTYAALFTVIGTAYGVGNGTTTFNIPDLRGRVPVGVDGAANRLPSSSPDITLGKFGGQEKHTLDISEIPVHTHDIWADDFAFASGGVGGYLVGDITGQGAASHTSAGNTGNQSAGGGTSHYNMQPYQITQFIIKT